MEPIKTQTTWVVADSVKGDAIITPLSEHETGFIYAEKKSDMVVMTVEEFKKVVGDAIDYGEDFGLAQELSFEKYRVEYLNQLIK